MVQFFVTKTHCIANNAKTATNAICKEIALRDYAEDLEVYSNEQFEEDPMLYRQVVPQTEYPEKDILMLIRQPIDRFISSASMNGALELEDIFNDLENGGEWREDHVMELQSDFVKQKNGQKITIFKFPEQLEDFCVAAGFTYPLEEINTTNSKIELTDDQLQIVQDYFGADIELYESL